MLRLPRKANDQAPAGIRSPPLGGFGPCLFVGESLREVPPFVVEQSGQNLPLLGVSASGELCLETSDVLAGYELLHYALPNRFWNWNSPSRALPYHGLVPAGQGICVTN